MKKESTLNDDQIDNKNVDSTKHWSGKGEIGTFLHCCLKDKQT